MIRIKIIYLKKEIVLQQVIKIQMKVQMIK